MIGMIACLSLVLLTGLVAPGVAVPVGLAGVAGVIVCRLASSRGIGWPWSPLLGILGAVILGWSSHCPPCGSAACGWRSWTWPPRPLNSFYFGNPVFGVPAAGAPVPRPTMFGFSMGTNYRYVPWTEINPGPLFAHRRPPRPDRLRRPDDQRPPRQPRERMLAMRSNERSAPAADMSPAAIELVTFGIATVVIALAGIMYG